MQSSVLLSLSASCCICASLQNSGKFTIVSDDSLKTNFITVEYHYAVQ